MESNPLDQVLEFLEKSHPDFAADLRASDGQTAAGADSSTPEIADYDIIRKIGQGGFGDVWLARNQHDEQFYALKTVAHDRDIEIDGIREFKKRTGSQPHLIAIGHVGKTKEVYYYVMPLADNALSSKSLGDSTAYEPVTLESFVETHGYLDPKSALNFCRQILMGLVELHRHGGIHRDVKPANILRFEGRWVLGDPGLTTALNDSSPPAGTTAFFHNALANSQQGDLYALGTTLKKIVSPQVAQARDSHSRAVVRLIQRSTDLESSDRYHSTSDMLDDARRAYRSSSAMWPSAMIVVTLLVLSAVGFASRHVFSVDKTVPKVLAAKVTLNSQELGQVRFGPAVALAREGDGIELELTIDRPSFLCTVALDPSGKINIDESCTWSAERVTGLAYPESGEIAVDYKVDGVGNQCFAVFSANRQVPDDVWRRALEEVSWSPGKWDRDEFWSATSVRIQRFGDNDRGSVHGVSPPKEFKAIRGALKALGDAKLVYLCMFPVEKRRGAEQEVASREELADACDRQVAASKFAEAASTLNTLLAATRRDAPGDLRAIVNFESHARDLIKLASLPDDKQREFKNAQITLADHREHWLEGFGDDRLSEAIDAESAIINLLGKNSYYAVDASRLVCTEMRGRPAFSRKRLVDLAARTEAVFGKNDPATIGVQADLAMSYWPKEKDRCLKLLRVASGLLERLYPDERSTTTVSMQFAEWLAESGEGVEAIELSKKCVERVRTRQNRQDTLVAITIHARILNAAKGLDDAVSYLTDESERYIDDPASRFRVLRGIADFQYDQNRFHACMKTNEEIQKIFPDRNSVYYLEQSARLVGLCERLGYQNRAIKLAADTYERAKKHFSPKHGIYLLAHFTYGNTLHLVGRHEEATEVYRSIEEYLPLDVKSTRSLDLHSKIAESLYSGHRFAESEKVLNRIDEVADAAENRNTLRALFTLTTRARIKYSLEDYGTAKELLEFAAKNRGPLGNQMDVWSAGNLLADCYYAQKNTEKAVEIWTEVADEAESQFRRDSGLLANPTERDRIVRRDKIASVLADSGKSVEAFSQIDRRSALAGGPAWEGRFENLQVIQGALDSDAAIIGWIDLFENKVPVSWVYILRSSGRPVFVKLDSSLRLLAEKATTVLRNQSASKAEIRKACVAFYQQRFEPLGVNLDRKGDSPPVKKLVVVSAGEASSLPLQAVLDLADSKRKYVVSQTPSASVYAWLSSRTERSADPRALLVADAAGDLPFAREVVSRIATCFPTPATVLKRKEIRDSRFFSMASNGGISEYDILHFATHVEGSSAPFETCIDLREQRNDDASEEWNSCDPKKVTAEKIALDWRSDVDLVVLAGCHSNEGYVSSGEGNLGLTQAFLLAGSRGVVVSHWPVSDAATGLLMHEFYQLYTGKSGGRRHSAAEALAKAKQSLRELSTPEAVRRLAALNIEDDRNRGGRGRRVAVPEGKLFSHPYYWAGFSLVGAG